MTPTSTADRPRYRTGDGREHRSLRAALRHADHVAATTGRIVAVELLP
jgi:hypothetical protein